MAVGDFNGDGKADLAVANYSSNNVSVLLGNGNGTFQAAVNYAAGTSPCSVAVGDFNGDGKADLAVANYSSNSVSVLLGNGNGTFQAAVNYGAGSSPALGVRSGTSTGTARPTWPWPTRQRQRERAAGDVVPVLPTTTALAAAPNPSTFGQPVTLTATVSPSAATGQVTFYDGTTVLGVGTLAGGTATLSDQPRCRRAAGPCGRTTGATRPTRQHIGVGSTDGELREPWRTDFPGGGELRRRARVHH